MINRKQAKARVISNLFKTKKHVNALTGSSWNFYKSLKIRYRYANEKKKKLKVFHVKIKKQRVIVLKGKLGVIVDHNSRIKSAKIFRKYLLSFLINAKKMTKPLINRAGVLGRGMFGWKIKRDLFLGSTSRFQKKGRKHNARVNSIEVVLSKKEHKSQRKKIKQRKKKKKKVYTWQVRRNNKWHRGKNTLTRWLTQVGERGHLFLAFTQKFAVKFKRKNTIYKTLIFAVTRYTARQSIQNVNKFLKIRAFGPYKVKGLKRLGQRGLLKEGKARKF